MIYFIVHHIKDSDPGRYNQIQIQIRIRIQVG